MDRGVYMTSQELFDLRKAHGLTQKALGAILGYSANYIARLERGDMENGKALTITPRCEKMIRLCFSLRKTIHNH